MSSPVVSTSATMVSAKAEPKVLCGTLENFTKENMGAFLGRGGDKLKKFVTVKSAIMVKDAYKKVFEEELQAAEVGQVVFFSRPLAKGFFWVLYISSLL